MMELPESCHWCPRFEKRQVSHWLAGNERLWEYKCDAANRLITPHDGVKPPPEWCPIREKIAGGQP